MRWQFPLGAALLTGLFAGAAPAWAGLEICNDTSEERAVAIGYKSGDQWVSEGWWNIPANECRSPVTGDLQQRYYYFTSRRNGWEFSHEDIVFCVIPEVFTITGDENCEARGYQTERFAKIDTGKTARQHTHFLSGYVVVEGHAGGQGAGSFGEPYADNVIHQGCEGTDDEEGAFCTFHGGGTKFFVYDDGRTPGHIFQVLQTLWPGTPLSVEGDLTDVFDTTAEVVLSRAEPRQWDAGDRILDMLQGHWYSVSDPAEQFTVIGAERENSYDGEYFGVDYLSVQERCDEWQGDGPYLYAREEESGEGLCFGIAHLGDWDLTLLYLPRGQFQDFRKLD